MNIEIRFSVFTTLYQYFEPNNCDDKVKKKFKYYFQFICTSIIIGNVMNKIYLPRGKLTNGTSERDWFGANVDLY